MEKQRKPDFIELSLDRVISTKGIMSIKQERDSSITVRYMTGFCETVTEVSMVELLNKLGRNPLVQGRPDSP